MKVVYMGTPDFSVGALEALIKAGHEVTAVVTQPDKAKGRSGQVQCSPVKECAVGHGIPVFQPVRIKTPEAVEELKRYEADIYVVAAFGQILSKQILEMPRFGCINIHASLLPKYRGAAPINQCIIDGEQETGVTIMQMDAGIDTGDILTQKKVIIEDKETAETLFDKLAQAGAELVVETLPLIENGGITPIKQDESLASHVKMMDKSMGKIDWTQDASYIERLVRGLNPWPSAYTFYQGKSVKIWSSDVVKEAENAAQPGTIVAVAKDFFDVACGKGNLRIYELQLEGKKRMDTKSFLLGNQWRAGMLLG
ncbi:MAG: methionyl-tRNA formyltransferase [Lachnospiraceae bacterium]|nr:methionyl-tRNA formyltransferase [Lachnospiraceae bacterium]MDE7201893.1 methionyl-tRNA formyltransferase [Lachnospiraceae bacterium]